MCGIAGFTRFQALDADKGTLLKMGSAIQHRGPDAAGIYIDEHVGLCHQRLSILDLSEAGNQPMKSSTGRYIIAYNGEVYNFLDLRQELETEGNTFKTHTDTEVILRLYEKNGIDFIHALNGMFAIAIWDTVEHSLFLARDRLGKKPLYYYQENGCFAFASEIKSLLCIPNIDRSIRLDAIKDYFAYQYIPDPKTIFKNIYKLNPGHWIKVDSNAVKIHQYWDVSFSNISKKSQSAIEEDLYNLLEDSVTKRMISDVPLGAFLSGGIDSSAIVGMMAHNSNHPITTCSIGFDNKKYDEIKYAKKVANLFNTNHNEFTVKTNVSENLKKIAAFFDEPFSDQSFVPTYFVSQLARKQVTVALAGDGGDENFAGYSKYTVDQTENNIRNLIPSLVRRNLFPPLAQLMSSSNNPYLRKGCSLLNTLSVNPDRAFFITNSFFNEQIWNNIVIGDLKRETSNYDPAEITTHFYNKADTDNHLSKILYTDIKTYLPGDILVKVDRMSMANSLETRAPILDYRVVEYAASIPSSMKLKKNEKKYILKNCLSNLLPHDILYRKKMGFSVPLAQWLRHEIKTIANDHLFKPNAGISYFMDTNKLLQLWEAHQSGKWDYSKELWSILIFELWWQNYMERDEMAIK